VTANHVIQAAMKFRMDHVPCNWNSVQTSMAPVVSML